MSTLFDLKTSTSELSSNEGITEIFYERLNPQRTISSVQTFTQGQINFRWEGSSGVWYVPSESYIEMEVEYNNLAGTKQDVAAANVAPAINALAGLFSQLEFVINNRTICRVSDYVSQCDTLLKRVLLSDSYLKSGYSNEFWDDFGVRVNRISKGGKLICEDNGTPNTGSGNSISASRVVIQWKPMCLGVFLLEHAIPSVGQFQLNMTPFPNNVPSYAIESLTNTAPNANTFLIHNMVLVNCNVRGPRYDDGEFLLDLENISCQSKTLQGAALSTNQFDVPPSTFALAVAYQDTLINNETEVGSSALGVGSANPNGIIGASTFRALYNKANPYNRGVAGDANGEMALNRFYVQYSNKVYPPTDIMLDYQPDDASAINKLTQLYSLTQREIDAMDSECGGESADNWFKRGMYVYINTIALNKGAEKD
jgi:hypothetical protein